MASTFPGERHFQVRQDVYTLAEARKIEADGKRLRAAKAEARKMIEENKKRAATDAENLQRLIDDKG